MWFDSHFHLQSWVRRIYISNPTHLLRIYVSVPREYPRQAGWQVSLLWARRDDSVSVETGEMPQVTVICGLSGDLMTLIYPYRWTWFQSQDRNRLSTTSGKTTSFSFVFLIQINLKASKFIRATEIFDPFLDGLEKLRCRIVYSLKSDSDVLKEQEAVREHIVAFKTVLWDRVLNVIILFRNGLTLHTSDAKEL